MVLDWTPFIIRGISGLGNEVMSGPTIEIPARVGLLREISLDGELSWKDYLVGENLDRSIEMNEDLIISWPLRHKEQTLIEGPDGKVLDQLPREEIVDWQGMEALWYENLMTI